MSVYDNDANLSILFSVHFRRYRFLLFMHSIIFSKFLISKVLITKPFKLNVKSMVVYKKGTSNLSMSEAIF